MLALAAVTAVALGWYDRQDVHVPVVITQPPTIGRKLSAWFRALPAPVSCEVIMLSPYAIDATCTDRDETFHFARWLEPGFPPIALEDFRTRGLVEFVDAPFTIDLQGVTTIEDGQLTNVPLDDVLGRTPRGKRLVEWLHARAWAGLGILQWCLDDADASGVD